jgi:hypothetical protein
MPFEMVPVEDVSHLVPASDASAGGLGNFDGFSNYLQDYLLSRSKRDEEERGFEGENQRAEGN